jgi:hypothetical protein
LGGGDKEYIEFLHSIDLDKVPENMRTQLGFDVLQMLLEREDYEHAEPLYRRKDIKRLLDVLKARHPTAARLYAECLFRFDHDTASAQQWLSKSRELLAKEQNPLLIDDERQKLARLAAELSEATAK